MVPEVPFAGFLFMDSVGFKWTQPNGKAKAAPGWAQILPSSLRTWFCSVCMSFVFCNLHSALHCSSRGVPLAAWLLELSVGAAPTLSSLRGGRERQEKVLETPRASSLHRRFPQPSSEGYPRGLGSTSVPVQPPQAKQPIFSTSPREKQPLSMF